ncbi:MAG: prepilin-type N-terminal cleavage/methylation domain-containing protein [Syntrophales bacterium]|jgi:general secretion pathway protein J
MRNREANRNFQNSRGFTLLEILIAIAITSMVIAALYSTFLLAYRAMFSVDKSLVKLQETRAFVDTLKREIESSLYSRDRSYCIFKIDDRDFYGRQASSLTVTSSTPLIKGLAKIKYRVEERNGSLVITKSMASAFSQETEDNAVDLLEDIESFALQAKYQDNWVGMWDSSLTKSVPEEVKIMLTVRMKDKEEEAQPANTFSMFDSAKLKVGSSL